MTLWQLPDSQLPEPEWVTCPGCSKRYMKMGGTWGTPDDWCPICTRDLDIVSKHVGPPAESEYQAGDVVQVGDYWRVRFVHPNGDLDLTHGRWMCTVSPDMIRRKVQPRESRIGDILLGLAPLNEYPHRPELW